MGEWSAEITQQIEKLAVNCSSCFLRFLFVSKQDRKLEPCFLGSMARDCDS